MSDPAPERGDYGRSETVNSQVSAFPGVELATDVSAALWLPSRLWPHHRGRVRVGECVPEGYPAYGRLLHPAASTDPGGPERWRWADIAAKRNYHLGPELRFNDLVGWDVSVTADPPPPYHAPDRGSLDETSCRALAEILPAFTTRPDLCWYCLWGGYGWPELPAPGAGPPRVTLRRSIDCLLFKGPVGAACNFRSRLWFQSPTAWWPDDHAWCVTTDVDGFSTYIADTRECIGVLASDPRLEILPTQVDHEVDPSPYPPRQ
jgi:hypothetical protein